MTSGIDDPREALTLRDADRVALMALPLQHAGHVVEVELTIDHPDSSAGGSVPLTLNATQVFRLQRWLAKVYQEMV